MPVTNYIWDVENDSYLMETDETDTTTAVFTNEPTQYGNLVSQHRDGASSYYHYDAQGSTRELTDSSGTVINTNLYDAWGVDVASSGATENPFCYVGELGYYHDTKTGSIWVRRRPYSPIQARWVSPDPLAINNRGIIFVYVVNNPVTLSDPSGLLDAQIPFPVPPGPGSAFDPQPVPHLFISANPPANTACCGGFRWGPIRWKLNTKAGPAGGYVVQHVRDTFNVLTCDDPPIDITRESVELFFGEAGNKHGGATYEFREAWRIPPFQKAPQFGDTFGFLVNNGFGDKTQGSMMFIGTARYHRGAVLPSSFVENSGHPFAGPLPTSTADDETDNPLLGPGSNVVHHQIALSWNCCCAKGGETEVVYMVPHSGANQVTDCER